VVLCVALRNRYVHGQRVSRVLLAVGEREITKLPFWEAAGGEVTAKPGQPRPVRRQSVDRLASFCTPKRRPACEGGCQRRDRTRPVYRSLLFVEKKYY
jgi:hypothetical protein